MSSHVEIKNTQYKKPTTKTPRAQKKTYKVKKPNVQKQDKIQPKIQGRKIRTMVPENAFRWNYASGARPNVMINVTLDPGAMEAAPFGIISSALSKGFDQSVHLIYWAYLAFLSDLKSLASNQTPEVFGRLRYLNDILASITPKSVPFKTGTLCYSWTGISTANPSEQYTIRGYSYWLTVPSTNLNPAGWIIMLSPAAPSNISDTYPVLSYLYNLIANDSVPHLKYVNDISLGPAYKKDTSSFCAISPYYGSGNAPSSGVASAENEVPFKSILLAGYNQFATSEGRVARNFQLYSGDSTVGLSIGLLPGFFPELYDTKYPIQFCYLDLDEEVSFLQFWYDALVQQAMQQFQGTPPPTEVLDAMMAFSFSPAQFRIAVGQCIRSMFADSQNSGQFQTYSNDIRGFEPLRMGSNCTGKPRQTMTVPLNNAENIRMLLPHILDIKTRFYNKKNQWILLPVWGIYKNSEPPNVEFQHLGNEGQATYGPMFTGSNANDPSVIDGTWNGNTSLDLNSEVVCEIITEWNQRINLLKMYAGNTAFLEGQSNGCLLFQTRFCTYSTTNQALSVASLSRFIKKRIPPSMIKRVPKLSRSLSKGSVEFDEVFIPPSGSLYTQQTNSYSSVPAFTSQQKQLINYLIYPTIVLEPAQVPTQQQVRVASAQCNVIPIIENKDGVVSRALDLRAYATLCAPGIAANSTDELSSLLKYLSDRGEGGFLRDVCVALAGLIPW